MPAFVLIVALSVAGAWGVARVWKGPSARLTVLGVLSFVIVVLAAQLVGVLAAATGKPLLTPWILAMAVFVLAGVACAVGRRLSVSAPREADGEESPKRLSKALLLAGALAVAFLLNGAIAGLSGPPRGWDVMTYHLPRAVAWLQHGNLGHYGFSPAFYPGNGEVAALVTLFSGSDRLTPALQFPFALLGAAAVYGLARELGARTRSALVAPLAFILTPMVVFQTGIAKNDLIIAGTVLAGSYMLVRALGPTRSLRERRSSLIVGGLALGLAAGTKYTAFPMVAASVPVAVLLLAVLRRRGGRAEPRSSDARSAAGGWRHGLVDAGLVLAAMALPSSFWLVQNWVATGNPFAPMLIKVGEWVVFRGTDIATTFGEQELTYVSNPAGWLAFPWLDRALTSETGAPGTYSSSVGFGAVFAAFAIPGAVALAHRAARRWDAVVDLRPHMLVALVVLGVASWWFGGFHLPRYMWPALAMLYAPMALLFDAVRGRVRIALVGIFVAAAMVSSLETLRIIHSTDSLTSSRLPWGTTSREHYHMPDIIYEFPPGTKIMLLSVPGVSVFHTFRYPLVGHLPGNEVVMMGDVGVETDLVRYGPARGHAGLLREEVDYLFLRTLALPAGSTIFDRYPDLYEKVLDTVEEPYEWYRKGYLPTPGEEFDARAPAVTKVYRVLGRRRD